MEKGRDTGIAANWSWYLVLVLLMGALLAHPEAALATNGMNMEGYGPIAMGMGGGSMAYDNGTAAMMNNPATMGMMAPGNRVDIALGYLGVDITAKIPDTPDLYDAHSTADSFFMPAIGWVKRRGNLTYGLGLYAQGGMGTEYDSQSIMSGYESMNGLYAGTTGLPVRSEVSVGRIILPLVAEASSSFYVSGSLDYVWGGMDLQMVMGGSQMQDMIESFGGSQMFGSVGGTMISTMYSMVGGMLDPDSPVNWAYFNFSNGSPYSGKAQGAGLAGKLGFAYRASKELTVGATYHSTTSLGDLSTDQAQLQFNMNISDGALPNGTTGPALTAAAYGKLKVRDFEWPQQFAVGVAYQPVKMKQLMVVGDLKWINWREVMRDFHMTFTATSDSMGGAFVGTELDATLYQRWKNQIVYVLGVAYRATDMLTLRAGMNRSTNPIPDLVINPFFPAVIKQHYTVGTGLAFTRKLSADIAVSYAPEVKTLIGQGLTVEHSQTNAQAMVSLKF